MISNREAHLFNHSDIDHIYYLGASDDEDKKFRVNLTSMIQIIQTVNHDTIEYKPTEVKTIESVE
jgi:hypothetical protein